MRLLTLIKRVFKEIIRDPLNIIFGLGFPVGLLLLMTAIQKNIPVKMFELEKLVPGMTVFGLSFMTVFAANLISKDRETAFLQRLYTSPVKPWEFILGYIFPLLPIALFQGIICYIVGIALGLEISINIIWALIFSLVNSIFFISLGLLFGSVLGVKQVGGICGALITNLTALMSGVWFDIKLAGKGFEAVSNALPFVHSVELEKIALNGDFSGTTPHIYWILGYTLVTVILAIILFLRQMKKQ